MEILDDKHFLMIEPDKLGEPTEEPLEDELSEKVDYLFSLCNPSDYGYRGFHITKCGKYSDNRDWFLPNGMKTNNLITYYVRHYRDYIPQSEMNIIEKLYEEYNK